MVYLLTISIILHIFTFFWIILLSQKINHRQGEPTDLVKLKAEIEDLLVAYTTEMKEDNEKVVKEILEIKVKKQSKDPHSELKKSDITPTATHKRDQQVNVTREANPSRETVYEDYLPQVEDVNDVFEQSQTAQVLMLAKQGLKAKEIAKRLSMGDGEVELVLKFYQ